MINIVKWHWDFGDGGTSTEPVPQHTYTAAGVYDVTLTVTDDQDNVYVIKKLHYIYVTDFLLGSSGLISGETDFCFRYSVKPSQGYGITPFGGLWIYPIVLSAIAKGYDTQNKNISLVINAKDMRIYQIGIPELWTDRAGTYEEAEIPCEAMLPEIITRAGDQDNVRHVETHMTVRPWDERNYRGKTGYTSDGFRDKQIFGIEVFEAGEQIVPESTLQQVSKDGDYAFLEEIEAKRFQLKMKYATSAFRTTRITSHVQQVDFRTPPQFNQTPEKIYQKEFAAPDIWFSKNKPSINTNRGDGKLWTGVASAILGPSGVKGAFNSSGLTGLLAYATMDFTIGAWILGDCTIFSSQVVSGTTFLVEVVGNQLRLQTDTDLIVSDLQTVGDWVYVAVVRRGNNAELYENGRMKVSQSLSAIQSFGGNTTIGVGNIFDLRRNIVAISTEALYYYYTNITGKKTGFLP